MASENTPKGRLQIVLACAAIVGVMLVAAMVLRMASGSRGLESPTASGSARRG